MLKLLFFSAAVLLIFVETKKAPCSAEERLKYTITSLTGKFLNKQVQVNPESTLAVSAFPAVAILAELAIYSNDCLQKELLSILQLNNVDEIRSVLPKYYATFNPQGEVKSELYFEAFTNKSEPFSSSFKKTFKELIKGGTQNVNYDCPEEAANTINQWGKDHTSTTKGEDVITKCEIPKDSGIIFVSTHDLQVNWDNPFNPKGMQDIEFNVNNNEVITMPALYGEGLLNYAVIDWLNCSVVELPMKGGENSVLLFSPDNVEGLADLLKKLEDPDCFYRAIDMLKSRCITVYVPLGEVNKVVDLKKNLQQATSTSIFDPANAELCGVTQGPNSVYVSSMLHQLHLIGNADVNEGNVTATTSDLCPDDGDRPIVIFNRPFVYYVMEKKFNTAMIGGLFFKNT
nr:Spi8 [Andraca theae]